LLALVQVVLRQKLSIAVVACVVGLIGVAYAFMSVPVCGVISFLRPAAINELDAFNRPEIYKFFTPRGAV
jgi:LPS O-antigen subunit length determinant protein (WzzB/FepE family)